MKEEWIWMPHPGHFVCAFDCRFRLTTKVKNYIISTVGEYFPDESVREMEANIRNIKLKGIGDERRYDFKKKIGYLEIGFNRKYETMVFEAVESNNGCCLYKIKGGTEIDFSGYNSPEEAYNGHIEMCEKYDGKQ